MSSDTTLVIAKVGKKYRAKVQMQAEFLEHKKRRFRWDAALPFLVPYYKGESFDSYEEVKAYAELLRQQEEDGEEGWPIEYGVMEVEIDLQKRDVRWTNLSGRPLPENIEVW